TLRRRLYFSGALLVNCSNSFGMRKRLSASHFPITLVPFGVKRETALLFPSRGVIAVVLPGMSWQPLPTVTSSWPGMPWPPLTLVRLSREIDASALIVFMPRSFASAGHVILATGCRPEKQQSCPTGPACSAMLNNRLHARQLGMVAALATAQAGPMAT